MQNEEQKAELHTEAGMAQNPLLGAVLFGDIPQQKWFFHQGVKLMKFGNYGMGVDGNGYVAKKFNNDMWVNSADCT